MKRILFCTIAAIGAMSLLSACKKAEPSIEISTPATIEVTAVDNSATLQFVSNTDWTATSSESWCKVSPDAGAGGRSAQTVNISLSPNETYETRTATITLSAGGIEKKVTVTQGPAVGLLVGGETFSVPKEGDRLTIPVQANVDYTVNTDADWITVVGTKGLQNYTITLDCAGNATGEDRSAVVNVVGGGVTKSFTVMQAACEHIQIVNVWSQKDDMELAPTDLITIVRGWGGRGYRGAGFIARIRTDLTDFEFDLLCSDDAKGWINKTYDVTFNEWSGMWEFYFEMVRNPGYEPRTGHIRIVDKKTGFVSSELTVYQIALPEHAIDMGTYVYWHEFNLGASAAEDYGDYYAWGELEPKTTFTWDTYNCAGGNMYSVVEHYPGGGTSYYSGLWQEHDAACQKLQDAWRMPSKYDFDELLATREQTDKYKWEWKEINGHGGWNITYLENGNSLFLPAAGYIYGGSDVLQAGTLGLYWSSTNTMPDAPENSYYLRFTAGQNGEVAMYGDGQRAAGKPIRPVTD